MTLSGKLLNGSTLHLNGGGTMKLAGTSGGTFTGDVTVQSSSTLAIGEGYTLTTPGVIHLDTGKLHLVGLGNFVANDFTGWQLNGTAALPSGNGTLRLTQSKDPEATQAGSAYLPTKQSLASLNVTFTYQQDEGHGGTSSVNNPADGMTFIVQNQLVTSVGGGGSSLGYAGITPSAAAAFNIYAGAVGGAWNSGSIGLLQGGAAPVAGTYAAAGSVNLRTTDPYRIHLWYDGTQLNETITDTVTLVTYTTAYTINLATVVGGNTAWFGFTGATGGLDSTQTISNLQIGTPSAQMILGNTVQASGTSEIGIDNTLLGVVNRLNMDAGVTLNVTTSLPVSLNSMVQSKETHFTPGSTATINGNAPLMLGKVFGGSDALNPLVIQSGNTAGLVFDYNQDNGSLVGPSELNATTININNGGMITAQTTTATGGYNPLGQALVNVSDGGTLRIAGTGTAGQNAPAITNVITFAGAVRVQHTGVSGDTLGSASTTIQVSSYSPVLLDSAAGGTLTILSQIIGQYGDVGTGVTLTKTGLGTIALGGSLPNTYTGDTTVNAGTLMLAKTAGLTGGIRAIGGNNVIINNGATVLFANDGTNNYDEQIRGLSSNQTDNGPVGGNVVIYTGGTLNVNGNTQTLNALTMNGGAISGYVPASGKGQIILAADPTFGGTATTSTIGAKVNLNTTSPTLRNFNVTDGLTVNITAPVTNGGIYKDGNGLLALTGGPSNYALGTVVNGGTLQVAAATPLGSGPVTLRNGTTFKLGGASVTDVPFQYADVGGPAQAGSHTYNSATGVYTISGGGGDIWGNGDQFQYAYKQMTGDFDVSVRATAFAGNAGDGGWTKTGIMARNSLANNAAADMVAITTSNGIRNQVRYTDGSAMAYDFGGGAYSLPEYLRLVRTGNVFKSYDSPDGTTWTLFDTQTIVMNSTIDIGLGTTAHNNTAGVVSTGTFDHANFMVGTPVKATGMNNDVYIDAGATVGIDLSGNTGDVTSLGTGILYAGDSRTINVTNSNQNYPNQTVAFSGASMDPLAAGPATYNVAATHTLALGAIDATNNMVESLVLGNPNNLSAPRNGNVTFTGLLKVGTTYVNPDPGPQTVATIVISGGTLSGGDIELVTPKDFNNSPQPSQIIYPAGGTAEAKIAGGNLYIVTSDPVLAGGRSGLLTVDVTPGANDTGLEIAAALKNGGVTKTGAGKLILSGLGSNFAGGIQLTDPYNGPYRSSGPLNRVIVNWTGGAMNRNSATNQLGFNGTAGANYTDANAVTLGNNSALVLQGPMTYAAGLLEGRLANSPGGGGQQNNWTTANPNNSLIRLNIVKGNNNVVNATFNTNPVTANWYNTETWVYSGQIYVGGDGRLSIGYSVDDNAMYYIDGKGYGGSWHNTDGPQAGLNATNGVVLTLTPGWHTFEARVSNGGGGAGGWYGVALTDANGIVRGVLGSSDNTQTNYYAGGDPGNMSIFRTLAGYLTFQGHNPVDAVGDVTAINVSTYSANVAIGQPATTTLGVNTRHAGATNRMYTPGGGVTINFDGTTLTGADPLNPPPVGGPYLQVIYGGVNDPTNPLSGYTTLGDANIGLGQLNDGLIGVPAGIYYQVIDEGTGRSLMFTNNTSPNHWEHVMVEVGAGKTVTAVAGATDPLGGATFDVASGGVFAVSSTAPGAVAVNPKLMLAGNLVLQHSGPYLDKFGNAASPINVPGSLRLNALGGVMQVYGNVTANSVSLTGTGGTMTIMNSLTSSVSNNIAVSGGTLQLGTNNVIQNGASTNVLLSAGGVFDLNGFSQTLNTVSVPFSTMLMVGSSTAPASASTLTASAVQLAGGTLRYGIGGQVSGPISVLAAGEPSYITAITGASMDITPGRTIDVADGVSPVNLTISAGHWHVEPDQERRRHDVSDQPGQHLHGPYHQRRRTRNYLERRLGNAANVVTLNAGTSLKPMGFMVIPASRAIVANGGTIDVSFDGGNGSAGPFNNQYDNRAYLLGPVTGTGSLTKDGWGDLYMFGAPVAGNTPSSLTINKGGVYTNQGSFMGAVPTIAINRTGYLNLQAGAAYNIANQSATTYNLSNVTVSGWTYPNQSPGVWPNYYNDWTAYAGRLSVQTNLGSNPAASFPSAPVMGIYQSDSDQGVALNATPSKVLHMGSLSTFRMNNTWLADIYLPDNSDMFLMGYGDMATQGVMRNSTANPSGIIRVGGNTWWIDVAQTYTGHTIIDGGDTRPRGVNGAILGSTDIQVLSGQLMPDNNNNNANVNNAAGVALLADGEHQDVRRHPA